MITAALIFIFLLAASSRVPPSFPQPTIFKFCSHHPCIFDLGHNNGQDTITYLSDPTANVLAVEASPVLIEESKEKFKDEISSGRLKLLGVGLSQNRITKNQTFWLNTANNKFSSFNEALGCRSASGVQKKGDHTYCKAIDVPITTCDQLIRDYGTPDYMKVDIEGLDHACIRSLSYVAPGERPKYVSVENVSDRVISDFVALGYKHFKVVEQAGIQARAPKHLHGHTGPWGEEAHDIVSGLKWRTYLDLSSGDPLPKTITVNGKTIGTWYDLHARL